MRAYHFTTADYAWKNVDSQRIKLSRYAELNDLFELSCIQCDSEEKRQRFRDVKHELNETFGILCFSKSFTNPLMWAHYGAKGKGVCLEFEVSDDDKVKEITYSSKMFQEPEELDEHFVSNFLNTKFVDWHYEQEIRLYFRLDIDTIEDGKYFYSFDDNLILRKVILGPVCEKTTDEFSELLAKRSLNAKVAKARVSRSSFEIILE